MGGKTIPGDPISYEFVGNVVSMFYDGVSVVSCGVMVFRLKEGTIYLKWCNMRPLCLRVVQL